MDRTGLERTGLNTADRRPAEPERAAHRRPDRLRRLARPRRG